MTDDELLDAARTAREMAYCPYSNFRVGAAILDDNGQVHVGCNVENASYPEGSCAETGAIAAMVAAGGQRIVTIAVVGGSAARGQACTPCGGCRQRIREFSDENTRIVARDYDGKWRRFGIDELLPSSFHFES